MTKNVKLALALVAAFVVAVSVALFATTGSDSPGPAATDRATASGGAAAAEGGTPVVRPDSNVLSEAPDGKVTLVEFLDLECEACGAAFPLVEQLRETYAGQVTFVARYFPIPSHTNAMNAAVAVQSAANQGQFEAMYKMMYETQTEWGESQDSKAELFRTYAEDIGLDLAQYDEDVADPATQARVEQDFNDGVELGVEGTPTFFLNGEIIQPRSAQDFKRLIDDALAA